MECRDLHTNLDCYGRFHMTRGRGEYVDNDILSSGRVQGATNLDIIGVLGG
jgi:hypothetical protein